MGGERLRHIFLDRIHLAIPGRTEEAGLRSAIPQRHRPAVYSAVLLRDAPITGESTIVIICKAIHP